MTSGYFKDVCRNFQKELEGNWIQSVRRFILLLTMQAVQVELQEATADPELET